MCYEHDIFNIAKEHPRRYVLSTGGEVDAGRGVTTPGVALYHEGLDLIAIVSTVQKRFLWLGAVQSCCVFAL